MTFYESWEAPKIGSSVDKSICDRIALVRKIKQLKVTIFADIVGIRYTTISDIESYRVEPSKKVLQNIIKKFDISGHWLLTGEGDMFSPPGRENRVKEEEVQYNSAALIKENQQLKQENERLKKALIKLATEPDPND